MKFLQIFTGKSTYFFCLFVFLLFAAPAQATTWDFNDGTNQGWTVEFNTDLGVVAAEWSSFPDYSGDPAIGLPPAYGPSSNPDDDLGAISGSTGSMATDPDVYTISFFASPIFPTAQEMDTISAQFSVGGQEQGINDTRSVSGRVGYSIQGDSTFYMGSFFDLNTVASTTESVYPLWTMASMSVADDVLVNQIFVSVWVDGTTDAEGTQHWIDDVSFNAVSGPGPDDPPAIPEPATMLLFGLGILGLAGVSRKKMMR